MVCLCQKYSTKAVSYFTNTNHFFGIHTKQWIYKDSCFRTSVIREVNNKQERTTPSFLLQVIRVLLPILSFQILIHKLARNNSIPYFFIATDPKQHCIFNAEERFW